MPVKGQKLLSYGGTIQVMPPQVTTIKATSCLEHNLGIALTQCMTQQWIDNIPHIFYF